jgi:hypothetical protein
MTIKEFWDGPLTWAGGIILAGTIFGSCVPKTITTNVHPDYIRDVTCSNKLTKAHAEAMEDDTWYTEGRDYSYLKATIFIPCQQKLEEWYIKHHPEYNRKVNLKDLE